MLMTFESTAGLTTVGYRIVNDDKTEDTALTQTGVTEVQPGGYGVNLADSKAGKTIQWYEGATYYVSERIPTLPDNAGLAAVTAATDTLEASATALASAVADVPTTGEIAAAVVPGIAAVTGGGAVSGDLLVTRGTDFAPLFDFGRTLTGAAVALTVTLPGASAAALAKTATVTGTTWQPTITDTETTALSPIAYDYKVTVTEGTSTAKSHEGLWVVTS